MPTVSLIVTRAGRPLLSSAQGRIRLSTEQEDALKDWLHEHREPPFCNIRLSRQEMREVLTVVGYTE